MAEHQKYKITDRIDAGGMAEVFRGVAESLQGFKKSVAIKRILPHLTKNKKFISMFLDEARLSLHLQHANIVGVFDIGVSPPDGKGDGGTYFIVMEFVDGTHLKGIIESLRRQQKTLTIPQLLYMTMEVCKGLAYAHDIVDVETGRPLGIVHRDISPPNILVSKNGEVKLVDFGLAKATSQLESTDPGVVKGKFSYLSPEAANGKEVDRRADIFAVGILMYEMLTGKRLFYGETDFQTVELVRQARVPSISQQNPDVEAELEGVVRKALARDVNSRFQTAGELQDAIAQYLFSRGMKVTSRDIAQLVRMCVAEREKSLPQPVQSKNLIGALIQEELFKFTSLEGSEPEEQGSNSGARPLSPEEIGRSSNPGPMIDTQNWAGELDENEASPRSSGRPGAPRNGQPSQPTPPRPRDGTASSPQAARQPSQSAVRAVAASARPAPPPPPPQAPPKPQPNVESLEDLLEGRGHGGQGQGATEDSSPGVASQRKPEGKGPPMALLVAILALVLLGGGAVLWLLMSRP